MREADVEQSGLFSYVSVEDRVPKEHRLRGVRALLNEAQESMHRDFERVYAEGGRASIPPERLVRALKLQILYSTRARAGGSALDASTTRHAGYLWSQRIRKRIEERFGCWGKDGRPLRKMKHPGHAQVSFIATLTVGCYPLLRVAKLLARPHAVPT